MVDTLICIASFICICVGVASNLRWSDGFKGKVATIIPYIGFAGLIVAFWPVIVKIAGWLFDAFVFTREHLFFLF